MYRYSSHRGFTLVELMAVLTIAAILVTLAVPSFQSMLARRSLAAAAESLVSDMRLARSEALARTANTVICRSVDGATCAGGGNWQTGWIVFVDLSPSIPPVVAAGDNIIKVQQALPNILTIQPDAAPASVSFFRYDPTGWARAANATLNFTPTGNLPALEFNRLVCVSMNGRPSLRAERTAACL